MNQLSDITRKAFKESINILIKENGGEVKGFAASVGVSRDSVNNWLYKDIDIRLADLIAIGEKYGKSIDWLLGRVDRDKGSNDPDIQRISDYTGLDHKAIELLHLHAADKLSAEKLNAINTLLHEILFYYDCLPALVKFKKYIKLLPDYEWNYDESEYTQGENDTVILDPEAAAAFFAHKFAAAVEDLLNKQEAEMKNDEYSNFIKNELENMRTAYIESFNKTLIVGYEKESGNDEM